MKGIDTLREIVKNMEKKEIVDLSYEEFINLMNKINDEENFMLGGNIWNIAVAIEKKRNTELFKYRLVVFSQALSNILEFGLI